ncbi:MAG: RNA polymerase sigma factor [Sandaracinaceae bacterium]|nr:RNA polymerase sigma factor [Myxococcales bacterium]MCB9656509.1 RNA polymerase sigma factor [Sandaracinaceae bacterium]
MTYALIPIQRVAAPAPDDEFLVMRALSGDHWAEEALYRRHVGDVLCLARRMLRNDADAEDVVQDVFVSAFDELEDLQNADRFGAWVRRMTVNRVYKRMRRQRLRRLLGLDRTFEACAPLASQASERAGQEARADLRIIDRALDRLGAAERIAWILRRLHGHSLGEVADLVGCSLATAKRRIARADGVVKTLMEGP